ncbi:MFS transporter [Actinomadura logoneensis]|uniref:MFS transporter n=1 Tax=Actinomadura logoneensis TaxID=2293572 RepID=A0A372JMQ0_9ACTN|nr:MFS transporter [Actinomadura logoneensis]RFU41295.1 MFS transporter [Actinomadura logoneensis]
MFASYGAVLRTPRAARVFGAALLGRLSYGTVGLSLTLTLVQASGSYSRAGAMVALFGGASCLLTPWRAGLVDRFGPRAALRPMAVLYGLGLAGLAAAAHLSSGLATGAVAVAAGACTPPLGPVMRALWAELVPDRELLQRAYSLDTVAEQVIFTVGPLLAGLFAVLFAPEVGVLISTGLVITGTLTLTTRGNTITRPAEPKPVDDGRGASQGAGGEVVASGGVAAGGSVGDGLGAASVEDTPGLPHDVGGVDTSEKRDASGGTGARGLLASLWPMLLMMATLGAAETGLALLIVAFAGAGGAAWGEAAMSVAGVVGGLVYGAVTWRMAPRARLPLLAVPTALALGVAGLAPGVPVLIAAVSVVGLFIAPLLTTAYLVAESAAPARRRTAVASWVNTAFNAGASLGVAGVGALTDVLPLWLCFVFAALPVLLAAGVVPLVTRRTGRARAQDLECAAEDALAV